MWYGFLMSTADEKLAALQEMVVWRDWNKRRDEIVRAADRAGYSQRDIADAMEISRPTVDKALKQDLNVRYHSEVCHDRVTSHTWESSGRACGTAEEISRAPAYMREDWKQAREMEGLSWQDIAADAGVDLDV
jgi:DNA-binding XRE family transcriptional regulator